MQTLMHDTKPDSRAALDPPRITKTHSELTNPGPSTSIPEFLSSGSPLRHPLKINVFYQHRKGVRLCMSNCTSIEVAVLWPSNADSDSDCLISDINPASLSTSLKKEVGRTKLKVEMDANMMFADQEQNADLSPTESTLTIPSHDALTNTSQESTSRQKSPFLSLPFELRLKIYSYILPSRHHTIATQIPHNGFFYNTSTIPIHSAQSFYPFGTSPPSNAQIEKLTTYKILSSNFRPNYPSPSIYPSILLTHKQIHAEAEPLFYSDKDTIFDFGTHLDACIAFWGNRSEVARRSVRNLRVAREVPAWLGRDVYGNTQIDLGWTKFCNFIQKDLTGLRNLDLTLWSSTGSASSFPTSISQSNSNQNENVEEREEKMKEQERNKKWREWDYTSSLLSTEGLREARVTWWGFNFENESVVEMQADGTGMRSAWSESGKEFDSWVAGRMVGDVLVRDRMIRDGVVLEGVVVLRGGA